jgi:NAD(P)-dependent dehydrogenase (short-subunit alcohol dehydrogenase family)
MHFVEMDSEDLIWVSSTGPRPFLDSSSIPRLNLSLTAPLYIVPRIRGFTPQNLNATYLPALHTSSVALRTMIKQGVQGGRIVFVSSFLGFLAFVGYTGYAGGKFAIRGELHGLLSLFHPRMSPAGRLTNPTQLAGLADTLRQEVLLYQRTHNLKIHLYAPAGIRSPGLDEEEKTKPAVTKKIEEGDSPMLPEKCVEMLLSGESGRARAVVVGRSWTTKD